MQQKFYVSHNDQRLGPFTRAEIQKKLDATELFPTDYVYVEDQQDWVMLADFPTGETIESATAPVPALTVATTAPIPAVDLDSSVPPALPPTNVMLQKSSPAPAVPNPAAKTTIPTPLPAPAQAPAPVSASVPVSIPLPAPTTTTVPAQKPAPASPKIEFPLASNSASAPTSSPSSQFKAQGPAPLAAFPPQPTTPIPSISTSKPAMTSSSASSPQFQLAGGVAEIKLTAHQVAEKVLFKIRPSTPGIESGPPAEVEFKAGPAADFRFEFIEKSPVGEPVTVTIKSFDQFGNWARDFQGRVKLDCSSPQVECPKEVHFKDGVATFNVSHTKAETIEIHAHSLENVRATTKNVCKINFQAGPAVRLMVEPPQNLKAGEEAVLTLKAVDRFGNVDANFKGSATLQIEGLTSRTEFEIVGGVIKAKAG